MAGKTDSREVVAAIEVGQTKISRMLSVVLSVFFLLSVFSLPLIQYAASRSSGTPTLFSFAGESADYGRETVFASINRQNSAVLKNLHVLESSLEDGNPLRKVFLPPLQYVLLKFLRQGNEKAIPGMDGWLFFSPSVEYLTGQPFLDYDQLRNREEAHEIWEKPLNPDPRWTILDFNRQLAARDIELLIVPVPVKAAIHPQKLARRPIRGPLANRSFYPFLRSLEKEGVHVFDPRSILAEYAQNHGDAYLSADTHWLPGAMQAVAGGLGDYVRQHFPTLTSARSLHLQSEKINSKGDIAQMVTLPEKFTLFPAQEVVIEQVMTEDNLFWQPDRKAEILLLGDSFTNIYSFNGLGWGFSAGFAEHLSHALQHPLDLLARNDSGAYVTREMLATELGRGHDRLAGKKLVIWQFAERELALGDWKPVEMLLREKKEGSYYTVGPGEKKTVTGVVEAISRSPRPGSVPYRDNIVTIHLADLQADSQQLESDQALVYGWGMQDNTLTTLAAVRPGDNLTLLLSSWGEVEGIYSGYRRTALDDEMVELETPNWGTVIDEDKN